MVLKKNLTNIFDKNSNHVTHFFPKDLTDITDEIDFKKMLYDSFKNDFIELLQWSPGIIFPLSHILQIIQLHKDIDMKKKDHSSNPSKIGIDPTTFLFFYIGNLGAFLFNRKYFSLKTWLAYIVPCILEIYIISLSNQLENKKKTEIIYIVVLSTILFTILCFTYWIYYHQNYAILINKIGEYAGFVPAVLFPLGILLQLIKIIKNKSIKGVSRNGWLLVFAANIGCYFLTQRYTSWKSISAFILSAIFSILIVIYITYKKDNLYKYEKDKLDKCGKDKYKKGELDEIGNLESEFTPLKL